MDPSPDNDVTSAGDLALLRAARGGDRLAFGLLYLRHHAAAWRVACVASRFSPDAELALIEGFTRVFSALPDDSEALAAGGVTFRPYLLACVRQAALDRARAAGRSADDAGPPAGAALPSAGSEADGEVVLSDLEHHAARGALATLPEPSRTALWLSDVEAMTPAEVAGILGGDPGSVAPLAAGARDEVRRVQAAALGRHEVRAECRFAADHLEGYGAATLDPADGVAVRAHLEECPPCRMRHEELSNGPAALAAAVPAAPLLGGEAQHHWLSATDVRPAARLLPPGAAAGVPAHRLPDALRRAGRAATRSWRPRPQPIDLTDPAGGPPPAPVDGPVVSGPGATPLPTGAMTPPLPPAWTVPPARATVPVSQRPSPHGRSSRRRPGPGTAPGGRAGGRGRAPGVLAATGLSAMAGGLKRTVWPALPAAGLAVAWVAVMLAVPWLMTPGTAPGPEGEALPAVQAYVPGFLPGSGGQTAAHRSSGPSAARAITAPPASGLAGLPGTTALFGAAAGTSSADSGRDGAGSTGGGPAIGFVSAVTHRSRPPAPALAPLAAPVATAPLPVPPPTAPATVAVAAAPAPTPAAPDPTTPLPSGKHAKPKKHQHDAAPETVAAVPERPAVTTTTTTRDRGSARSPKKPGARGRIVTA